MANQIKKLPNFTADRRRQLLAQMMETGLSSREIFDQNSQELMEVGVTSYQALHKILYPLSREYQEELNKLVARKGEISQILAFTDFASLDEKKRTVLQSKQRALRNVVAEYNKLGFNPLERTSEYETISSGPAKTDIFEDLENLCLDDLIG